jgi:GNAT superfamily N-acetyltransferase
VRPAAPGDVGVVLDVLAAAAEWTAARGQPNWPERFPTRLITNALEAGELFVAEIEGSIAATLQLQWSDPFFWGETDADANAGYVHRLAVVRAHAGQGVGLRLLEWADEQIRARDRAWLRVDVVTGNRPLRDYYESAGFGHRRDVAGEHEARDGTRRQWQTSLYERSSKPRR